MKKNAAFTLIETIIVVLLLGILSALTAQMINSGMNSYMTAQNVAKTTSLGKLVLMRFERDIRDIQPGNILTATATNLRFRNASGNVVRYFRAGTNLRRREQGMGPTQTMLDNLENSANGLRFTYFQNDGVSVAVTPAQVYYIQMQITMENPLTPTDQYSETMNTIVFPRNFR